MKTRSNIKQTEKTGQNSASCYTIVPSPVDNLTLVADDTALTGLHFAGHGQPSAAGRGWTRNDRHPVLREAAKQLREYFAGKRAEFTIPLRLAGTPFQEKVWRQIALIPHGETISYGELAKRAGSPRAIRAAGTSTGRNPVAVIIPCHRVMGKNGDLCGFGGGLDRKRRLLAIEKPGAMKR